ncbi:alpha-(1,3)-fucosyltransferase 4 [Paroedura picta]|uniref:alpha-(1,3)-fucosyltransferase 4 n=1 Tax=Paroedura picta TaxID=143630 RepID=UPI004057481C
MAGRGGQVGPRAPPEGQGAGRRRWPPPPPPPPGEQRRPEQQQQQHAAAPSADPEARAGGGGCGERLPAGWQGASMEPAGGGGGRRRRRRGARWLRACRCRCAWRPSSSPSSAQGQWRLLAAGLTCCAALALYAASSLHDLPGPLGRASGSSSEAPLRVLLWWEPFGRGRPLGDCRARYNISACSVTANRSGHGEAHAILFHHRDLAAHGAHQLPAARPPAQRWVWMNFESPSHSPGLRGLRGLFNWTMSYRVDSDVFVPYGYLRPRRAPPAPLALPAKRKLVAWVISNWNEEHARVRYFRQLRRYLPVDVYGARGRRLKDDSVVETVADYKFYLAFENSQHQDYITEKLWRNAFKSRAVPVVLGPPRSNYELFIPADSFIHVDDFASPAQLAIYLKFLDKNKSRYRRYFAWRRRYDVRVTAFWDEHCCRVCEAIRAAGHQRKTVQNLAHWFES